MSTYRRFRQTSSGLESPIKAPYNQPSYNHFDDLSIKECAGLKDPPIFGIEPFKIPKHGLQKRVCHFGPSRSKNIPMFDIVQKEKSWVPGPIY